MLCLVEGHRVTCLSCHVLPSLNKVSYLLTFKWVRKCFLVFYPVLFNSSDEYDDDDEDGDADSDDNNN